MHFNKSESKAKFSESLQRVLQEFLENEWLMLYPLAKASVHGIKESENDVPLPRFVTDILKQCDPSMVKEEREETRTYFIATSKNAVKVLQDSLFRTTKHRDGYVHSVDKMLMYDLSSLSEKDLRVLTDYLRLPNELSATRDM